MSKKLVILGSSGSALDVIDIVAAINGREQHWDLTGILDDVAPVGHHPLGLPNFGRLSDASRLAAPGGPLADAFFINAIGSPSSYSARAHIVGRTGLAAERFAVLVHPGASVSAGASLGRGCCVNFGASIAGRVRAENHVWIGPCCVVGHDSVLETHAVLASGSIVSGSVRLGACCYVGSAAVVRQGVSVEPGALIGMGAVVVRDVATGTVVVGNPARVLYSAKQPLSPAVK